MFASFHSKGTIPSSSDMLNTCASGVLICSTVSFSIVGDIPSTPLHLTPPQFTPLTPLQTQLSIWIVTPPPKYLAVVYKLDAD